MKLLVALAVVAMAFACGSAQAGLIDLPVDITGAEMSLLIPVGGGPTRLVADIPFKIGNVQQPEKVNDLKSGLQWVAANGRLDLLLEPETADTGIRIKDADLGVSLPVYSTEGKFLTRAGVSFTQDGLCVFGGIGTTF